MRTQLALGPLLAVMIAGCGTIAAGDLSPAGDPAVEPANDLLPTPDGGTGDGGAAGGGDRVVGQPPAESPAPAAPSRRLVAYWASWTREVMPVASIPWGSITHLAHAFVLPSSTGGLRNVSTYVDPALIAAAHANGVKVVASVGGWGANFDANVDATARAKTVAAMASLCRTHGYDGIDLDWEYPTGATAKAWASMVRELRDALDAIDPALSLSAAVSASPTHLGVLPDAALNAMSWIGVMTYDFAGSWSSSSGHNSPLNPSKGGSSGSVRESIDYLSKTRAFAPDKLLVGLPFYGYDFGATSLGGTPVAPCNIRDYRDLASRIDASGWKRTFDDVAQAPYLTRSSSPGFTSYDDATSIGAKCAFTRERGLGGAIVWHLAGDLLADGKAPLLVAAQGCR
ncbi:MAG: glycoside hydrolase family 18 protein [Deltaproteobacteria bacterium]|nr:glycoside hydrolase family 18 protein [Deltaproteobacteria bacterium]